MPTRTGGRADHALRAVQKLISLGPGGWWLLAQAQIEILRARRVVRQRPRGALIRDLGSQALPSTSRAEDARNVQALGLAVNRVVLWGIGRSRCLVRSLALHRLIERQGIPGSRIRVGVRMNGSAFEAHAWVEWRGEVVGEDPSFVHRFEPLSEIHSPAEASLVEARDSLVS